MHQRGCSTRSKVAGVFTSGATAALIRESFPNQKGIVVSETAPMPEDLLDISLEEVIFTAEWAPEEILPDTLPVFNSSQEEIIEITSERNPEKVLEPEKEKPVGQRSGCLRSSAPGQAKKKKGTRKRRVQTQLSLVRFNSRRNRSCLKAQFKFILTKKLSFSFWLIILTCF